MKELSLNILDIAQNSVRANATLILIELFETDATFTFSITDDGCGMDEKLLKSVTDPFTTTRTTRKVGLGIPLLKLAAEMTGGYVKISSSVGENHGTKTKAHFFKNHIDYTPLGDIIDTICTLVQGSPNIDFVFTHEMPNGCVSLDTRQMREILGDQTPLNDPEILVWIRDSMSQEYEILKNKINII